MAKIKNNENRNDPLRPVLILLFLLGNEKTFIF